MQPEELRRAVEAGLTERQIAAQLGCTKTAVHYWLGVHGLRTQYVSSRDASPPEAQEGRAAGLKEIKSTCPLHGGGRFTLEASGYYRCVQCRAGRVADRRRAVKAILVTEFGGACAVCGYDRSTRALEFHHLDPTHKRFGIGERGVTRSLAALREEAAKCVLLCSNCHAEVECGMTQVPSKLVPRQHQDGALGSDFGQSRQPLGE